MQCGRGSVMVRARHNAPLGLQMAGSIDERLTWILPDQQRGANEIRTDAAYRHCERIRLSESPFTATQVHQAA
jgi:hypothetical protein